MTSTDQTVQHPGLALGTATGRDSGGGSRVMAALGAFGTGLLLGVGWGIAARVWMRLVSTVPDFSWTGTLVIVGLAALAGAGVVRVDATRGRGTSGSKMFSNTSGIVRPVRMTGWKSR